MPTNGAEHVILYNKFQSINNTNDQISQTLPWNTSPTSLKKTYMLIMRRCTLPKLYLVYHRL